MFETNLERFKDPCVGFGLSHCLVGRSCFAGWFYLIDSVCGIVGKCQSKNISKRARSWKGDMWLHLDARAHVSISAPVFTLHSTYQYQPQIIQLGMAQ